MKSEVQNAIQPVAHRISTLDALRGFALLGIYLSIIHGFNGSIIYGNENHSGGLLNKVLGILHFEFISLRFIGIFSLLFGLGISIQERRFMERSQAFAPYFIRRMAILACFGLINTTFFFSEEILLVYAVFGLVFYFVAKFSLRFALALAAFFFVIWGTIFELAFRDNLLESFQWFRDVYPFEKLQEIYREGSLWRMIKVRWIEYRMVYVDNGFHMGVSVAMIICGYAIGTKNLHMNFLENLDRYRKHFLFALIFSLLFAIWSFASGRTYFIVTLGPISALLYQVFILSSLFSYVYAVCILSAKSDGNNVILNALANNGRLSLTGYMGGALAYSLIFYANGLGLYLTLNTVQLYLVALATYSAFTAFSFLWLKKFDQGPMEWIFRKLSYPKS